MEPERKCLSLLLFSRLPIVSKFICAYLARQTHGLLQVDSVSTEADFLLQLDQKCYSAILCGQRTAQTTALETFLYSQLLWKSTPVICIAGLISRKRAVDIMKKGVSDLIALTALHRLPAAVDEAIRNSRAQSNIKGAKAAMSEAFRIAGIGTWHNNLDGDRVFWSEEMYHLMGCKPDKQTITQDLMLSFLSDEERERVSEQITRAVLLHEPVMIEHTIVRPDGRALRVLSRGRTLYDESGAPYRFMCTVQDVTGIRSTERKLFDTNHLLNQIIENASVGIYWKDTDLRITGCNKTLAEILGVRVSQAVGKQARDLIQSGLASMIEDADRIVLREKKPLIRPFDWKTSDGRIITCLCKVPLYAQDGTICGVLTIVDDVTEIRRNEQKLFEAMQRLEEAQRISHIGNWQRNLQTGETVWSDEVYRIFGVPVGEVEASLESYLRFVHEEDRADVERSLQSPGTCETLSEQEFRIVHLDGSIRHAVAKRQMSCDETGNPLRISGTLQDITDFKATQEEMLRHAAFERTVLRLAENFINIPIEKLSEAIDSSLEMVGRHSGADRASIYQYDWERGHAVLLHEWVREPKFSLAESLRLIPLENLADVIEVVRSGRECVRGSASAFFSQQNPLRAELNKKQAQSAVTYPLMLMGELWGAFTLTAEAKNKEWPQDTKPIYKIYSEMLISVMQRRNREAALNKSYEENRTVLESTNDGIALLDTAGKVLNYNGTFARRFPALQESLLGMTLREILPSETYGDLFERRNAMLRAAVETGESVVFEDSRDGQWFLNRFYPVKEGERVTAVSLFSTDITARVRMKDEIREKEQTQARLKVMTEFFTNVSHEFKTPLSVILMQFELMKLYLDDEQSLRGFISAATQNAYRLSRLVSNILDLSKLDAGFMNARYTMTDIVVLVHSLCQSVQAYAKTKGIQLCTSFDIRDKVLPLDGEKVERILLNLLSNAIKYTPQSGYIEVRLRTNENGILLAVEDNGEGIPPDKQKVIFDRFATVDSSTTRAREGCGIGLALVKSMVDLLGGSIVVSSEVGKGSTFIVWLPLLSEDVCVKNIQTEGYDLSEKTAMEFSDMFALSYKD